MNREQWLGCALETVRTYIRAKTGAEVPANTKASCGFPGGGSARKRIGECWSPASSQGAVNEIFISPVLDDTRQVLDVLLHEAIHAAVGVEHGHKKPFRDVAVACGLTGKMTATVAGEELKPIISLWIESLGGYPHARLNMSGRKKQSTRLIKVACPSCGYTLRTTQKWIDVGMPTCCCGIDMTIDGQDSEDGEGE